MKTAREILYIAILPIILLSCVKDESRYFGAVEKIINDFNKRSIELSEDAQNSVNNESFGRLLDKKSRVQQNFDGRISDKAKSVVGTVIDCSVSDGLPYEVSSQPEIFDYFYGSSLDFKVRFSLITTEAIRLNEENFYHIHYYMKLVDKEENLISLHTDKLVMANSEPLIQSGMKFDVNELLLSFKFSESSFDIAQNGKLFKLDKIVFITEKEYNELINRL